jgi:hypothetical protein
MGFEAVFSVAVFCAVIGATALGRERIGRLWRLVGRLADRVVAGARALRPGEPHPAGRPIELIAHDAQRLGPRFRHARPGVSFARFEAGRQAYDGVLVEACRALGVEHLLLAIPPGPDLDAERLRVEALLERAGLRLDDVA